MSELFLDTGVLVGAASQADAQHLASRRILARVVQREWRRVYTSDLVLAEALNFAARKMKRLEAADAILGLVFGRKEAPPVVSDVLRVHGGRLATAIDRFRAEFKAGLTLTDWSSVVLMKELRIDEIATFDRGLNQFVRTIS
ncbi:MAG: type II toxin-antitoxin system VapC family toxin [Euryarchaeota archaeon]|nr:type II toxin-antitoxin system VapC family toxin [Euryarchaeota archaeon]